LRYYNKDNKIVIIKRRFISLKCLIIYFSQTGNTEKIAKAIQTGVKQAAGNCDLLEMRNANPLRLGDYDLIGIGSPVMGADPANVGDFVNKMRFVGGKHIFTFCTHGTSVGFYLPSLYPKLKNRGLVVIGSADWYGDCVLLHMPEPYPTAGHPDEIDLQEAENYGREMVMRSWKISAGQTDLIPPAPEPPPMPKPKDAGSKNSINIIESFGAMLKYDKSKCLYPNCKICMENCPTFGIDLSVDPPLLAQPCLGCEFCARVCPTGALNMDEWVEKMIEMSIGHRPKMLAALEKAEAEGHFRRKISVDKLDLNHSGYQSHKKHPQWIIGKGVQ
jgi:flavodoxin/ferredoxin